MPKRQWPWDLGQGYERGAFRPEGEEQHNAFLIYARMGPDRSTAKVAEQIGAHPASVRKWAARYKWTYRAAALEAHVEGLAAATPADATVIGMVTDAVDRAGDNLQAVAAEAEKADRWMRRTEDRRAKRREGGQAEPLAAELVEKAQETHLERLRDYRRKGELAGKNHYAIGERFVRFAAEIMQEHERKRVNPDAPVPYASLNTAMRLAAIYSQLSTTGLQLVGQALGVDQMLESVEAIRENDARALLLESADPGDVVVEPLPAEPEEAS